MVPRIKPVKFEDFPAFRETFLVRFTLPGHAEAFRTIGQLIDEMANEYRHYWPDTEPVPRAELRAALADLRHLEGYLGHYLGPAFPSQQKSRSWSAIAQTGWTALCATGQISRAPTCRVGPVRPQHAGFPRNVPNCLLDLWKNF